MSFGVAYQRGNVMVGEERVGEDFGLREAGGQLVSPIGYIAMRKEANTHGRESMPSQQ